MAASVLIASTVAYGMISAGLPPRGELPQASEIQPPGVASVLDVLDPDSHTRILVVPTPLDERSANQLISVSGAITKTRVLDNGISAGIGRGLLGVGDQRLRIVGEDAVYVSLGETVILPLDSARGPIEVGRGVYLLPSATEGRVWMVGSGARWVRHLDVKTRSAGPEVRLEDLGRPLAAVSDGLILSVHDSPTPALAVWDMRNGVATTLAIDASLEFIAAAGLTVVLSDGESLLAHDIADETTRALEIEHAEHARPNEFVVSPLGSSIAIAKAGTLSDLPVVDVYDLKDGRQMMEIDPAIGWQLQWISETEILYLDPTHGQYALSIADVETGLTRRTIGLKGSSFWFAGRTAP
ncbi:MAG: hypothetical protein KJN63_06430 [Acidimicrobiia bacterium]|nr:hypothetical protein [Acidimicrobiia bacterium]